MSHLLLDFEGRRLQGARPFAIFESRGSRWSFRALSETATVAEEEGCGPIWPPLRRFLAAGLAEHGPAGGAIGYLGYDLARELEPRAFNEPEALRGIHRALDVPDIRLEFYDELTISHLATQPSIYSSPTHSSLPLHAVEVAGSDDAYRASVETILDYIAAGDIYQANLTRRFSAPLPCPPAELYARLQTLTPMPHAALLEWDDFAVISHSPERFLQVENGRITAEPIKGTRRRSPDAQTDERLRCDLSESEKDRAENVMIVDLLRNDLGRVCKFGTVEVPELYAIRSFPTVHHGVSTVTGVLKPGLDALDALQAAFPCGSITGAPKIRAMQIIDELEPVRRGIAMGSVGWIGFNGNCDWNVAIRTVISRGDRAYFHVGGGIVADSTPQDEAAEIEVKASALCQALAVRDGA